MANVDQRKYLKKYLDDVDVKRHKKKSREHSSSRSERVRIVDDDGEYKPSRKYDDDNDFILTGEDAPQVVGIVDDRPPELRAVEDFRNSSKWRSLETSGEKSRAGNRLDGNSQKYSERRRSRSRSPVKRDYSPARRAERKEVPQALGARKRRSSDDYSPVRRKPEGDSRYREANYSKNEKGSSYSYENNGRKREDLSRQPRGNSFGQHREAEPSYRDGHVYHRSATYTRPYQSAYAQRNHHDGRRPEYTPAENGRSKDYHAREGQPRVDNRYPRNELEKPNPFRANSPPTRSTHVSHRDDQERRRSPVRSSNPFRAGRPATLSPLPDKRGDAPFDKRPGGVRPQKISDGRSRFDGHGGQASNYGPSAHQSYYESVGKGSNPFRGQNAPPGTRSSGPPPVKGSRTDSAQSQYRPQSDRAMPPRGSYYPGYEKRPETSTQAYSSYRRSKSPIKSSIQIVNSASQYPRIDKRYASDRREQPMSRSGGAGYPPQQSYIPRKPPPISGQRDLSPVRKTNNDSDLSPVRNNRKTDQKDSSPIRRRKPNDDQSPIRRRKKAGQKDLSPSRTKNSGDDQSPIRRRKRSASPINSIDVKFRTRKSRFNSPETSTRTRKSRFDSPPSDESKMQKTLDGKRAGLQDAKMLKKETEEFRRREDELFKKMSSDVSGRNADVVVRDKKSGRVRDLEEDRAKNEEKQQREKERQEIYNKWGKGLKQVEDYRNQVADDQYEGNKPLARYSDDADLDKMLRDQERDGDPMLAYMRQKSTKTSSNAPKIPTYNGPYPDNRFNIRPGYRWDGVDRSNGYEKKWLTVQNQKFAIREEAYRYSTEDM